MPKKRKTKPDKSGGAPAAPPQVAGVDRLPTLYLGGLSVAVIVCWSVLNKFFFAQDDFTLLYFAADQGFGAFTRFFESGIGQFRPLTKGLYFLVMHNVFGLNAGAFHWGSLLLHVLNTILVYVALRRFRIGEGGALTAATLFGVSTAFFNVLSWIACVQEIIAMTFVLLATIYAVDAITTKETKPILISLAAYILGVMSMEQAIGLPVFLAVVAVYHKDTLGIKHGAKALAGHAAVMLAVVVFMLFWKRPAEGRDLRLRDRRAHAGEYHHVHRLVAALL